MVMFVRRSLPHQGTAFRYDPAGWVAVVGTVALEVAAILAIVLLLTPVGDFLFR